jgi:hypothetical protein
MEIPATDNSDIGVSVDDCFVVIDLATPYLAPSSSLVGALGETLSKLGDWEVIWDLRGNGNDVYQDTIDAYRSAAQWQAGRPTALVTPGNAELVDEALAKPAALRPRLLKANAKPLVTRRLDLKPFSDDWVMYESGAILLSQQSSREVELEMNPVVARERIRRDVEAAIALGIVGEQTDELLDKLLGDALIHQIETAEKLKPLETSIQDERRELLQTFLEQIASNSLLAQIAFIDEGDRIRVVPMHANALHRVDCDSELLAVRPARRGAAAQWKRFGGAIAELEEMINRAETTEAEIESLLRRNPLFLKGLNYTHAYHQVVLPMGDGRSLRPDIIVEPVSSEWADIIDLKLPSETLFVGSAKRPQLSQAIARAASQLRQYARWFDDRAVSRRVEDRYGFKCFKPKQVVIIGRDPRQFDEAQREAAVSAYPDLEIVTYDQLLRVARRQLLF